MVGVRILYRLVNKNTIALPCYVRNAACNDCSIEFNPLCSGCCTENFFCCIFSKTC